jgi:hypothetical protein
MGLGWLYLLLTILMSDILGWRARWGAKCGLEMEGAWEGRGVEGRLEGWPGREGSGREEQLGWRRQRKDGREGIAEKAAAEKAAG